MIVTCGSEWTTTPGFKRDYSTGLDLADGEAMLPYFTQLTRPQQHRALGVLADLLVLTYMLEEGAIDQAFYDERKKKISSKLPKKPE